jgi:hypothetical protein
MYASRPIVWEGGSTADAATREVGSIGAVVVWEEAPFPAPPATIDWTLPTRPSVSRTLIPRGWLPRVRSVATVPETVRPVVWSAFKMMLTSLPGITSLIVGTRDILV